MSKDYDEEFNSVLGDVEEAKQGLGENDQTLVDAWIAKLKEFNDDEKPQRNEYANYLKDQLTREDRHLSIPFIENPPTSQLPNLQKLLEQMKNPPQEQQQQKREARRYLCAPTETKVPCRPKAGGGPVKQIEWPSKTPEKNEFEDLEEMAKVLARSKGMMLPQFVADISRHTVDRGIEMRNAMKHETTAFGDFVERILTQRIKDLGELLDDKQNYELMKIQKDYDKWQSELSNCKKRLKEIVPDFDLDAYRKDRNYFKKIFSVGPGSSQPTEDKYKEWKEENCHRLMWFVDEIEKLTEENDQVQREMSELKLMTLELEEKESRKQHCHENYICEEVKKSQQLKQKSDKLAKEITDLLLSLEN